MVCWPLGELVLAGCDVSTSQAVCVSVCLSLGGPVWPLGGDEAGQPQRQSKPVISGEGLDGAPPPQSQSAVRGQAAPPPPPP